MSVFLRVPIGIIIMLIGFVIIRKVDVVLDWFGRIAWAEEKLGGGGSRMFYKLIGVLVAVLGVFVVTNIISDILTSFAKIFVRGA